MQKSRELKQKRAGKNSDTKENCKIQKNRKLRHREQRTETQTKRVKNSRHKRVRTQTQRQRTQTQRVENSDTKENSESDTSELNIQKAKEQRTLRVRHKEQKTQIQTPKNRELRHKEQTTHKRRVKGVCFWNLDLQMKDASFIRCVWRPHYLSSQMCVCVIDQFHSDVAGSHLESGKSSSVQSLFKDPRIWNQFNPREHFQQLKITRINSKTAVLQYCTLKGGTKVDLF